MIRDDRRPGAAALARRTAAGFLTCLLAAGPLAAAEPPAADAAAPASGAATQPDTGWERWSLLSLVPFVDAPSAPRRELAGLNSEQRWSGPAAQPAADTEFRRLLRSIVQSGSETAVRLGEAVLPVKEEGVEFSIDPDEEEVYLGFRKRF